MISIGKADDVELLDVIKRSTDVLVPNAEHTLEECVVRSAFVWAGRVDGKVACLWGLIPPSLLSAQAYLWLITTDLVGEHKFLFVRYSQRIIEMMLKKYPVIYGTTTVGNYSAIRWLKWLGAEYGETQGRTRPFVIRKKNV